MIDWCGSLSISTTRANNDHARLNCPGTQYASHPRDTILIFVIFSVQPDVGNAHPSGSNNNRQMCSRTKSRLRQMNPVDVIDNSLIAKIHASGY